ncbi:S8 family serine peptidase [Flavobacterium sp. MFBS3-15]|uniref:S8 family serine peptidase n=1 Tax=Flavobacterium sp. MFBS3-15 TaxID=2989816 RepID=UPI00223557D2|nr:S8 family serine peptidase [Flavobacterium sp. MFBS3-15]MCW4467383.1 S8 family serine peptidase [Flavobacterium sp. MFBS3-15]
MKKNTMRAVLLAGFFLAGFSALAQTAEQRKLIVKDNNLEELARLEQEQIEFRTSNYAEALRLAGINGWPLEKKGSWGERQRLMGVTEDGVPLYFTNYNLGAAITTRANKLHPGGGMGLSLTGQGMLVGVWDGEQVRISHQNFGDRVEIGDSFIGYGDHATHIAGTIAGGGTGNAAARGIAYEANIRSFEAFGSDTPEMIQQAAQGMLVSNHSYGFTPFSAGTAFWGAYWSYAKILDDITFNAPRYQPVVSAGNDNNQNPANNPSKFGYDLVNCYATSKNAIVVAAVHGVNNYTSPNSVQIANFSSWGPTDDNRIKPDISAKGVAVFSSYATNDTAYGTMQGTSMAAPGIAGSCILLQQHYNNVNGVFMWSSTLRGLVAHTADECGDWDGPDPAFGWGLMNSQKAAQAISDNGSVSIVEEKQLTQGQPYTRTVTSDGVNKLVATISWTDRSGNANTGTVDLSTPVLRNNLDIRVTKVGGEEYMPWKFADFMADAAIQGDNNVDNIEKVEIEGASGEYVITVSNKGTLVSGAQNYSLIVTGIEETAGIEDTASRMFNVWPNPADDQLTVSLPSGIEGEANVQLFDIQGRVVARESMSSPESTINIDGLSAGMYIVSVTNGSKTQTKKVVIK